MNDALWQAHQYPGHSCRVKSPLYLAQQIYYLNIHRTKPTQKRRENLRPILRIIGWFQLDDAVICEGIAYLTCFLYCLGSAVVLLITTTFPHDVDIEDEART